MIIISFIFHGFTKGEKDHDKLISSRIYDSKDKVLYAKEA
jgi:hypothetical protein